jgi:hypothetical protein
MIQGSIIVASLTLASLLVGAQKNTAVHPQSPSGRILHWSEKPDPKNVENWLSENESVLNRGDACTFTSWQRSEDPPYTSSSVWAYETFVTLPEDEELTKVIHDPESGLDIGVGVRYARRDSRYPYLLQLALAFEGPADHVFEETNRAEAETVRSPNWRSVGVVKPTRVGNMEYTFSLHCENGREYRTSERRMFSRHQVKSPNL